MCRLHVNIMPFYIRDLWIHWFQYQRGPRINAPWTRDSKGHLPIFILFVKHSSQSSGTPPAFYTLDPIRMRLGSFYCGHNSEVGALQLGSLPGWWSRYDGRGISTWQGSRFHAQSPLLLCSQQHWIMHWSLPWVALTCILILIAQPGL